MALYTNLPVYKIGYDLIIEVYKRTTTFSREYKYTIGERLKAESLEMIINLYKANKSKTENRIENIELARKNVEVIRLLLRIIKDLKIISLKGFVFLNLKIEDLSKQLVAWQKYTVGANKPIT